MVVCWAFFRPFGGGGKREGRRRTGVGVEVGVVEVLNNLLDGRDGPVPFSRSESNLSASMTRAPSYGKGGRGGGLHLEVAADEELASHDGRCFGLGIGEKLVYMLQRCFGCRCC